MEAMKHIAYTGFGFVLFAASVVVPASAQQAQASSTQSQNQAQPSLADYARQMKKDSPQPKSRPKVFDNDNLPKDDKLSVVGELPPVAADKSSEAKPADPTGNVPAATDKKSATETKAAATENEQLKRQAALKEWQQKLTAQKDQIDLADRELDVLKREYQIRAAAFYADAGDRLRNSAAWDKQDTQYKQQIADKQKALDDAKQKLEEMQEDARKAGIPAAMREQ
ncbi:MAG: hypothetical protein DMG76_31640 [Acidobacteria bacterium]|jgi:hypothetical protein|nr:MAG: hypothetical protein DMG76_31640 [Acidobacteriota bacterium]